MAMHVMAHKAFQGPLRRPKSSSGTAPAPISRPQYNASLSESSLAHDVKEKMLCFCEDSGNEQMLYQDLVNTCTTLIQDPKNVDWLFQVFSLCSWIDRQRSPIISKLFHELTMTNKNSTKTCNSSLLLCRLENTCKEFLQVLTLLGMPSPVQFGVTFLLSSMSRLDTLPRSFRVEVFSYLEELARAFWPYCMPNNGALSLWDNDNFVDALSDILIACGEGMETQCPVNMDRTFKMVDRQLVSNGVSPYSRYRLLEVRELRTLSWKLNDSAKDYYKTAYRKHIGSLKSRMAKVSFGANTMKENLPSEGTRGPIVLRIHENTLTLESQDMQEGGDFDSSISDSVFTEEDEQELEAQLASHESTSGNSCTEKAAREMSSSVVEDACSIPATHVNKQPAAKVSMSTFVRGKVVPPRRPYTSDAVAFNGRSFDKRRIFSADTKDPRNPEFSVRSMSTSPESKGTFMSSTMQHSSENLHRTTETLGNSASIEKEAEDSESVLNSQFTCTTVPTDITPGVSSSSSDKRKSTGELQASAETPSIMELPITTLTADTDLSWREKPKLAEDSPSTSPIPPTEFPTKLTADTDLHWRKRPPVAENSTSNLPNATETPLVPGCSAKQSADTDSCWRDRSSVAGSNGSAVPTETSTPSASCPWTSRQSGGFGQPPSTIQRNLSFEAPRPQNFGSVGPRRKSADSFPDRGTLLCKEKSTGGFGSPNSSKTNSCERLDNSHHLEIHLDEEEVQRLRGFFRKFFDIQRDSGCQINQKGRTIEISGNLKSCKAAKQKIYELVSAPEEEYGILIPLPEMVLEFVQSQSDKEVFLARLAVLSGANVRQISEDQIFLSGRRNFVNSAKSCLAKVNVMLKYRDDPDIDSSVDREQRGLPLIQQLFENLEFVDSSEKKPTQCGKNTSSRISYSRSFLLSCAKSPPAVQRPGDLALDRDDDWVQSIVLTKVKEGEHCVSGAFVQCSILACSKLNVADCSQDGDQKNHVPSFSLGQ